MSVFDVTVAERRDRAVPGLTARTRVYLRRAAMSGFVIAVVFSTSALQLRFGGRVIAERAAPGAAFLLLWVMALWLRMSFPQLSSGVAGHIVPARPRPPLPAEAARYAECVRRRPSVKRGLTGL